MNTLHQLKQQQKVKSNQQPNLDNEQQYQQDNQREARKSQPVSHPNCQQVHQQQHHQRLQRARQHQQEPPVKQQIYIDSNQHEYQQRKQINSKKIGPPRDQKSNSCDYAGHRQEIAQVWNLYIA